MSEIASHSSAGQLPREFRIALGEERLVVHLAQRARPRPSTRDRRRRSPAASTSAARAPAATVGENSRSVISTFASPWSSMNAIASASSRVLSVLSTAPHHRHAEMRLDTSPACWAASPPRCRRRRCRAAPAPRRGAGSARRSPARCSAARRGSPTVRSRIDGGRALDERQRRQRRDSWPGSCRGPARIWNWDRPFRAV